MCKRVCLILSISLAQAAVALADDGRAPSIPETVAATATAPDSIELTWQSSSDQDGIKGYSVYRDGSFLTSTQDLYYRDQNLSAGTTYEYWIVAEDNSGQFSSTSRWVYERTLAGAAIPQNDANGSTANARPEPPTDLSAEWQNNGSVELTWSVDGNSGSIEGFNVYRNDNYLATTHDPRYIDQPESADATLGYNIVAFTTDKQFSPHSVSVNVLLPDSAPPPREIAVSAPAIPSGLSATVHSSSSLTINWSASAGAKGYNVYRDDQYVATVWSESWSDSGLSAAQRYRYSVVAFDNSDQYSRHSDTLPVETSVDAERTNPADNSAENGRSETTNNAISSDYSLAFSDEFNNGGLDFSKWNTAYLWGPNVTTNNESQYYVDIANQPDFGYQPFTGNGEHLSIQAEQTPDWLRERANGKPYVSGVMTSYDSFQFTYGYAEARLRAPKGNGFFAAFWLLNAKYIDLEPEIDITELLGENPYVVHHTYHYYDANDNLVSSPTYDTWVDDFSADFHTYAVRWSPGEIVWYVDGRETQRLAHDQVSQQPMYVLFNLAIDGDWPQSPDGNTVFPSSLDIDYVRVYRK